ncbi:BMP family ABC transporter substrate-binding protein [Saccharomonospora sp. CUA-673]|uniref:BMP family lipoprotein n=1 Tax=Saccharomonospora sp. CUA-673 TaxID=1904969 RepID=UPI0009595BF1|nr:BMP family ABC transporter substrate-binding protein [Saccharomonospora sp. CUA-673]OLT47723.1 BMP family ABC transporter substrate-binding protein [Saccharomonospora sp. CUA-673]
MAGVLTMAGCAKDSGSGDAGAAGGDGGGGEAGSCVTQDAPAAPEGEAEPEAERNTDADASDLKVGLAFDVGGRGDASFNDAAALGVDEAVEQLGAEKGAESPAQGTESEDAKQQRLEQMANQGNNPIIAVGFAYAEAVAAVAPKHPDTEFAIVDDDSVEAENVTSLVFAEEEGSFLAGVAAAYKTTDCQVGFIGGVDTPLIQKFEAGFEQGVEAAGGDNIEIRNEYLTPAGDISGFNDPAKANVMAGAMLSQGTDVVFHAAGASGQGVFEAAAQNDALAIGVDSDQYEQKTLAEVRDVIVTSMLKRVDVAVYDYIAALAEGNTDELPERFDLSVDGVDYSDSNSDIEDITDELEGYKQAIIDGEIDVSDQTQG